VRFEAGLPPIFIEEFREERPRFSQRRPVGTGPALTIHPPGYEFVARIGSLARSVRQDYERTVGTHRNFHPRMQSRVEHRIDRDADDAIEALRCIGEVRLTAGPLRLVGDPKRMAYDSFERESRVPSRLHLPWSWPDLPMWLSIGEVSTGRCALRLSLRSRRRLRYPVRYFHAAHAVLSSLESRLATVQIVQAPPVGGSAGV
jgi:hypothetical protein